METGNVDGTRATRARAAASVLATRALAAAAIVRSRAHAAASVVAARSCACTAAVAIACVLAGCASSRQIAEQVVGLNKGLEDGHNGLLLLNVVRAYQHRPMHFMRIAALRGAALPTNTSFFLPLPVGGDAVNAYNFGATLNTSRPSFETQILDNQEFIRGITTPVTTATMLYYLDQGWPQQMVLHLFVRRVDVLTRDGDRDVLLARYANSPQDQADFAAFQRFVGELRGCEIRMDSRADRAPYGPVIPAEQLRDVGALLGARREDLQLVGTDASGEPTALANPTHYRLFEIRNRTFLRLNDTPAPDGPCVAARQGAVFATRAGEVKPGTAEDAPLTLRGEKTIVFSLRSPEAMVFYLGEVARAQLEGRYDARSGGFRAPTDDDRVRIDFRDAREPERSPERAVRLFTMMRGEPDGPVGVKVELDGETWSLPAASRTDRSMHALSLVSQVLMLQNKGAELPSTTSVRIVP